MRQRWILIASGVILFIVAWGIGSYLLYPTTKPRPKPEPHKTTNIQTSVVALPATVVASERVEFEKLIEAAEQPTAPSQTKGNTVTGDYARDEATDSEWGRFAVNAHSLPALVSLHLVLKADNVEMLYKNKRLNPDARYIAMADRRAFERKLDPMQKELMRLRELMARTGAKEFKAAQQAGALTDITNTERVQRTKHEDGRTTTRIIGGPSYMRISGGKVMGIERKQLPLTGKMDELRKLRTYEVALVIIGFFRGLQCIDETRSRKLQAAVTRRLGV